jgi:hypothetical protein
MVLGERPTRFGGAGGLGRNPESIKYISWKTPCFGISGSPVSHPITSPPLGSATYSSLLLTSATTVTMDEETRPQKGKNPVTGKAPVAPTATNWNRHGIPATSKQAFPRVFTT